MGRRYKFKLFITLLAMCLILGVAAEGSAAKKYLSLGTGSPGGTFYFIGAGFANLINKHLPEVRVIAEATAAAEENFHLLSRKKMDLGFGGPATLQRAVEKGLDLSGIRLMGVGHTTDYHWIVRNESLVKDFLDFRGRRVIVGNPGSGSLIASAHMLEAWGLTFNDFKPAYLTTTECITALKDNTVDVGFLGAGYPAASLLDLGRQISIRLIPYCEEGMKRLIGKWPYYVKVVIPAGTYRGVDVDTVVVGSPSTLFCCTELGDDLIYKIMKAIYDHPKEKDVIHPQAKQWNLENIFRATDYITKHVPFHPGAIKYLKEKGVWKEKF